MLVMKIIFNVLIAYLVICTVISIIRTVGAKREEWHVYNGQGMSFVEVLSMCPTGWSMSPVKSLEWIDEKMTEVYPLGVMKDTTKEEQA